MIVLDTNVISELMRPTPNQEVMNWVARHSAEELTTTASTVAEVAYGLERLPTGRRKQALISAADEIFATFADAVLAFEVSAAQQYATLVALHEGTGRPISVLDAQIASICLARNADLATRNTGDFEGLGLAVINPWAT